MHIGSGESAGESGESAVNKNRVQLELKIHLWGSQTKVLSPNTFTIGSYTWKQTTNEFQVLKGQDSGNMGS